MNIESVITSKYDEIIMQPRSVVSPEVAKLEEKHGKQLGTLIKAMPNSKREIIELCDVLGLIGALEDQEFFEKGFLEGMQFMEQLYLIKEKVRTAATVRTSVS